MARAKRKTAAREDERPELSRARAPLTSEDVNTLVARLTAKFGWTPHEHQVAGVRAQLEGVNMIVQAPTGSGKTAIAAGPHVWPGYEEKTTLMVCPLLTLEEEMVETFAREFGLPAIALNSTNGACERHSIDAILRGAYRIIILSPEMAQARVFVDRVLRNATFMQTMLALFIDEAHCVSHWGSNFRKKYGTIGNIVAFLPRGTPVIAVTATLTARVRRDIHRALRFQKGHTRFLNLGNDRPNVSLVVRPCNYPLNTFADLNFFVPAQLILPTDIPKTYIYVDSVPLSHEIADYLGDLLCARAPHISPGDTARAQTWRTYARPFNASLSPEYRAQAMAAFRRGDVRVLVCTEAAGMRDDRRHSLASRVRDKLHTADRALGFGAECWSAHVRAPAFRAKGAGCNIRDVDIVIQWRRPSTMSNFVQRAGRAARDPSRQGLAVLLVEKSAYTTNVPHGTRGAPRKRARLPASQQDSSQLGSSQPPPSQRGQHGARSSQTVPEDAATASPPSPNPESPDEGLGTFVQTRTCRRAIIARIFESPCEAAPVVPCCDVCDPTLLDQTLPAPPPPAIKAKPLTRGEPDPAARRAFYQWRERTYVREHALFQYDETAVLSDALIEDLVSVGPLTDAAVRRLLFGHWPFWDKHGEDLQSLATSMDIAFTPLASSKNKQKPGLRQVSTPAPPHEPLSRPASTVSIYDGLRAPSIEPPALFHSQPTLPLPPSQHLVTASRKRPASRAGLTELLDHRHPKHSRTLTLPSTPFLYPPFHQLPLISPRPMAPLSTRPAALSVPPSPRAPTPRHLDTPRTASPWQFGPARDLSSTHHLPHAQTLPPAHAQSFPQMRGMGGLPQTAAHPPWPDRAASHTLSQPSYSPAPFVPTFGAPTAIMLSSQPVSRAPFWAPAVPMAARARTPRAPATPDLGYDQWGALSQPTDSCLGGMDGLSRNLGGGTQETVWGTPSTQSYNAGIY